MNFFSRNYLIRSPVASREFSKPHQPQKNCNMELWKGKVAVVTGASSGIGAAIAKDLCRHGMIVVGLARRLDRLQDLQKEIVSQNDSSVFHPLKCDLTSEAEIQAAFDYVTRTLGGVDFLVNNAGTNNHSLLLNAEMEDLRRVIELNLVSVISCTKKAFQSMSERDVPGYIINISSVSGHSVTLADEDPMINNVYAPTKYAVRALNQVLRHELNFMKKDKIRVSNVSPGLVRTELTQYVRDRAIMEAEDISNAVVYLLGTEPRVQVEDFIIRPKGDRFV